MWDEEQSFRQAEHERLFDEKLEQHNAKMLDDNSKFFTEDQFINVVDVVTAWESLDGKERKIIQQKPGNHQAYQWVKKYETISVMNSSILVFKAAEKDRVVWMVPSNFF